MEYKKGLDSAKELLEGMANIGLETIFMQPSDDEGNVLGTVIVVRGPRLESFNDQFRDWEIQNLKEK